MPEYIEREALLSDVDKAFRLFAEHDDILRLYSDARCSVIYAPAADVAPVVHGYHEGDVCIYGFGHENKSRAIVEIVRILNDERGVAEVKFLKVFVDDTGNGYFNYLLKSGSTMNASFQYLKNITPRMDGE